MAFPIILSNSLDVVLFRDKEGLFYQILLWSNLNLLHICGSYFLWKQVEVNSYVKTKINIFFMLFELTCLISDRKSVV